MLQAPSATDIRGEKARRSLYEFVKLFWPVLEPGKPFVDGIHIRLICERVEAVTGGTVGRLIINVPPRHGKSNIVSILWPAWVWASKPETRWLTASYAQPLAERHSSEHRRIVESALYQQLFGATVVLASDANQKSRFANEQGGARIATSIGGSATGEGGDVIVIDDPIKAEDASSDAARQGARDAFDFTFSTRLNDPRTGAIVLVSQRLHERDLTGHLLTSGEYEHLCLPAEYDPDHVYRSTYDPRTTPGELLWPARFGAEEITGLKRGLGSYGSAAQLQQLPSPAGGGIFLRKYWRWYHPDHPPRHFERLIISADLAYTGTIKSDYTVGQLWGLDGADKYLLHQIHAQLAFPAQLQMIRDLISWATTYYRHAEAPGIYIEHAANADAMAETLNREIPGIILRPPRGDKETRANAIVPQAEAGNIYLPGAPNAAGTSYDHTLTPQWAQGLVEEAAAFPNAAHDDRVDALNLAISELSRPTFRIRSLN